MPRLLLVRHGEVDQVPLEGDLLPVEVEERGEFELHTVEGGVVKTGRVRLARCVTVGLGSMIGINVEAGEHCQIGALSVVLKGSRLEGSAIYAGVPARKIERNAPGAAIP